MYHFKYDGMGPTAQKGNAWLIFCYITQNSSMAMASSDWFIVIYFTSINVWIFLLSDVFLASTVG